ncbi:hypothetical protein [Sphingomonas sp. LT1P40]|uniref:hypothetical protein n=1 Tax=Alteristakelama amylovorans TaxID=3096166 RepID=UPI002FC6A13F
MMTGTLSIETERERHMLFALASMASQYLENHETGVLDNLCMGAGEEAFKVLAAFGLIDAEARFASWTEAGEKLLDLRLNQKAFPA